MTNEIYIVTNSVVTSLDVLKSVNDLYSSEFTRLLTVMGLLVGLVGAAVIVLPLWFQIREAKVRRAEFKSEFQAFIAEAKADIKIELEKDLESQKKSTSESIKAIESKLKEKTAFLLGQIAHNQSRAAFENGHFWQAAESAIDAAKADYKSNDQSNLLRVLGFLIDQICPKLFKEDLEHRGLSGRFDEIEAELKAWDAGGFLSDKLTALQEAKQKITKKSKPS
ncbi:MAG: hypothetical protein WAO21_06330 [Verrucomicrobiia bacterium]